jgi:Zn-dependent protease with chaperone function
MTSENDRTNPAGSSPPGNPGDAAGFRAFQPEETPRRRRGPGPIGNPAVSHPPNATPEPHDDQTSPTLPALNSPTPTISRPHWRNADRAQRWQPLPPPDVARLQMAQLATFLAVPLLPLGLHTLWVTSHYFWMRFATGVLRWRMGVPRYEFPVPGFFGALVGWGQSMPNWLVPVAQWCDVLLWAGLTFWFAPLFLSLVLKTVYKMQPLSIARFAQVSPETQRRLQSGRHPMPQFGLLPHAAPIIFAYGHRASNTRIVLSQGLLDQLDDAEIAAICSGEASAIGPLNLGLMSWILALLQLPYLAYGLIAQLADHLTTWGSKQSLRALEIIATIGVYILGVGASIAYIVFTTMRWLGLWFTRQRSIVADHAAANITGNPNAQARALLKIAHGISQDVQTQGQTDFGLEAWELAMPVGYQQAVSFGSLLNTMPVEEALAWDWGNGQRHYLSFNNSHALLGGRLARLMQYAQQWQLPGELDMRQYAATQSDRQSPSWWRLINAGLPFWGAAIGYGIAMLLWAIAWIGFWVGFKQVAWLGSDFRPMYALPVIGFAIGSFLRFNQYFPDLPSQWLRRPPETAMELAPLLADAQALPDRAKPTALSGQLLGRQGVANWLAQDLWLRTAQGLVRLHYPSAIGWLTNVFWAENRVTDLRGQAVHATGWLRRGATPWMDAESLRNDYGKTRRGNHQIWNTIVATMAIVIGLIWLGALEDLISVITRWQNTRR